MHQWEEVLPNKDRINLDYEAGYRDYCEKFSVSSTHYILLF